MSQDNNRVFKQEATSFARELRPKNTQDNSPESPYAVSDSGSVSYLDLNAEMVMKDAQGNYDFGKDKEAARQYFLQHVNKNTIFFHDLEEKFDYLVSQGYYNKNTVEQYDFEFIKKLFKLAYSYKFRFSSFMGAYKFYTSYALKTYDGDRYLERYEDRVCMIALHLAQGDEDLAIAFMDDIMTLRTQPATPIMLNAGLANRGELVSCQLLRSEDSMESIGEVIKGSLQLSKRGGGVGICLTNIREEGSPIKGVHGASSGIVPVMKILDDSFRYANQLGARQGAGAVYLSVHHPDVFKMLDTKRENADDAVRIKTLSVGLVFTDKVFELAKKNKDYYMFSPYDVERVYGKPMSDISITDHYDEMVEDSRIRKYKASARDLFMTVAELQFESGYPYLMFEDRANEHNNVHGRISMSNLCSEILQVNHPATFGENGYYAQDSQGKDISCNLASINIKQAMNTGDFGETISNAVRLLSSVSDQTSIDEVPTIKAGNDAYHSIGIGAMNLHGFLASEGILYGSEEALDFVNVFFGTMRFHALNASMQLARETGEKFFEFDKSDYAAEQGEQSPALKNYTSGTWTTYPHTEKVSKMLEEKGVWFPQPEDWDRLSREITTHGLYNSYLLAVAPNGSSSFLNFSTSSIHPVEKRIQARKEGRLGRVFVPAPGLNNENFQLYPDAFEVGPEKIIDTYAVAQKHVDQALSCTLFFWNTDTTRDLNRAYIYAWSKHLRKNDNGELALFDPETEWKSGIMKTLYYSRVRSLDLSGTETGLEDEVLSYQECESCTV